MLIRSSVAYSAPTVRRSLAAPSAGAAAPRPSFGETAIKSTIIGASLGTVAGEALGKGAAYAGAGYLGWKLGQSLSGGSEMVGLAGAAIGAGASMLLEDKLPIGGTIGAAAGFVTGGLVGGIAGSVIGGVQIVANSNLFKKS